jgi:hypothetical protein
VFVSPRCSRERRSQLVETLEQIVETSKEAHDVDLPGGLVGAFVEGNVRVYFGGGVR